MSDVHPQHGRYKATLQIRSDGRSAEKTVEEVDAEFVVRFCRSETRAWFEGIGGKEFYFCVDDVHIVVSISPDGTQQRFAVFTPIPGESD